MKWRAAPIVVVVGCIAGCVRLSQPAPQIHEYRLDYTSPQVTGSPLPVILRVALLGVAATYDRAPIVYRESAYAVGTDFYSRWSTNPGPMVTDLLGRDLAYSGLYRAVQQGPAALSSDYQLGGEIEEIEERITGGACAAHLRMRITLMRVHGAADPVVLRNTYTADEPCPCNDVAALAAAMSQAMERISVQLQSEGYAAIAADVGR